MKNRLSFVLWAFCLLPCFQLVRGEAMVQYFNTSYEELMNKMPELAEVGYNSMWLPPPTKGSGGLSVGYDLWDRFDLGSIDQRNTVRTRYGTEEELLRLIRTAHRFGIRVYFDNIMNHNAFDVPGFNEFTPIDVYPGFVPEDFHLRVTEDGFYRKWDNTRNWQDAWQVQNLGLSDLIDIAHEDWNQNFGPSEGSSHPKYRGVRHPNNPEYYCFHPTLGYVGFNSTSITEQVILDNPEFYTEDVNALLIRSVRWFMDRTKADGLRLDAVKHVPAYFFGQQSGLGKDESDAGYLGAAQRQFNITRGFSDPNHRDTVFDTEAPRDDAMMFGEHLGEPPSFGDYVDAGMRLVDNDLRSWLNGRLGSPFAGIDGLDNPGGGGFNPAIAVMHAQSHDNDYAARRELQHATYFTRAGLPLIYTDGNYQAETLGESGGAFPRHANTAFLGQFGDNRVPNLVYLHNLFARGYQASSFSDGDYIAYERLDNREGHGSDEERVTMLFMMNDNFANGASRNVFTRFPKVGGTNNDAYLYNYSSYGGGFYVYASQMGGVVVPPGGYFIFSYRVPEESTGWQTAGGSPISIEQNGQLVTDTVLSVRRDGPDGDPGYNPRGLAGDDPTDYEYALPVPRVTNGTNLSFVVRADGSAKAMLLRLDGGMDLNGINHAGGDPRDNPPALSTDVFLGYEGMNFQHRQHREKFAAEISNGGTDNRSTIWSPGAETWEFTVGQVGSTTYTGSVEQVTGNFTAQWVYHDPENSDAPGGVAQLSDPSVTNQALSVWMKVGVLTPSDVNRAYVYYTTDDSFPEGAGGDGLGTTKSVEMFFQQNLDGGDWWKADLPVFDPGTRVRYKLGVFRGTTESDENSIADGELKDVFPINADTVDRKKQMLTAYRVDGINGETISFRPHNDYGETDTGLEEGFHFLSARVFLDRSSGDSPFPGTSLYNDFKQTFYYDNEVPGGEILFPKPGDTLGGNEYEVVVRTDRTVEQVVFHIDDLSAANDDGSTGNLYGNGTNALGVASWVSATRVSASDAVASAYPLEWRFKVRNIPSGGIMHIQTRFLELSSSTNHLLTAAEAHVGEASVSVFSSGPSTSFAFDWPRIDGTQVNEGWTSRVNFSSSLGNGYNDEELRDSFTYEIRRVGETMGTFQPKSSFVIIRDAGSGMGTLEYDLPNLWDPSGDPDQSYELIVRQVTQGGVQNQTSVRVTPTPVEPPPFIDIVEPEEVDVIGNRQDIEVTGFPTNQPVIVHTETGASNVWVDVAGQLILLSNTNQPEQLGADRLTWSFTWVITNAGPYRITAYLDEDADTNSIEALDQIDMTVVQVLRVPEDAVDQDDDDDGMHDYDERNQADPLQGNPETWSQEDVHDERSFGRTQFLNPDSDGDGLSDGLELGYRAPRLPAETDLNADVDGDGFPNFQADLDPPFFNTLGGVSNLGRVPDVTNAAQGGDRKAMVAGTVTDPNNPDSDYDGIPDGIEDANRNGWVDGDGELLPTTFDPWLGRNWPDGERNAGEVWTETDPNNPDTDGDGLADGFEDGNQDGWIAGDVNSNRVFDVGEVWTETDPLNADTDLDGLPDGWELRFGFNALDDGTNNWADASSNTNGMMVNGPLGNPDGDVLVLGGQTNAYTNLAEFENGTDPRTANLGGEPTLGSITIGPGPQIGTVNGEPVYEEFMDWKLDDLLVLDEYEGDGPNNRGGDIFPAYDGFDSSRDIVAFYMRDGGDIGNNGDGRFYFRLDFHDLQAFAEEGQMDFYIVVDTGEAGSGERALPDEVDTITDMRWEAVIAVYDSRVGRVYLDTNPVLNSSDFGQELTQFGVQVRDQNSPDGFLGAYFNSELDAVEVAISRAALTDAGWNGLNADDLRFQVFTTKEGTSNDPVGAGDLGGRSDIRDTIYDDRQAEDYWRDQDFLDGILTTGFSRGGFHDRGKRAKVAMVVHGNQHIRTASEMHDLVNNGQGAGYFRVLDPHEGFAQPLNLHVTATLASALQWAAVDPVVNKPWKDGALLNARISSLIQTGIVDMLGTTFSDHMMPYFPEAFQADNIALANEVLQGIYGSAPSARVVWTPERLVDNDVIRKVRALGYSHTLVDQMRHVFKWYGRTSALTDDGYRIQNIDGGTGAVGAFVINDQASTFRFDVHDSGLGFPLRRLVSKKARSGQQEQLITLLYNWEDFGSEPQANAYDEIVRWLANRQWIELVSLDDVAAGGVDLSFPPDGNGDNWGGLFRGFNLAVDAKVSHDFIDHATAEDYDNWYLGSGIEEGLNGKVFESRPGVNLPKPYGIAFTSGGMIYDAWNAVQGLSHPDVQRLGRMVLHASVFETAFHNQSNNNLSKFSTGEYVWPDSDPETLADFSAFSQAQGRKAAILEVVDDWVADRPAQVGVAMKDVDLDGVDEWVVSNDVNIAVFETAGGRCVGWWMHYPVNNRVFQLAGTHHSFPSSPTEEEGTQVENAGEIAARRTSLLSDWFGDRISGDKNYVNETYTASAVSNGVRFVSADTEVDKTMTMQMGVLGFTASYDCDANIENLYIRNGLSPDTFALLQRGTSGLGIIGQTGQVVELPSNNGLGNMVIRMTLNNASWNASATDRGAVAENYEAVNMRNQAQVQQVEVFGSGQFAVSFSAALEDADFDEDGIPDTFELDQPSLNPVVADGDVDSDSDGADNFEEWVAGTDLDLATDRPELMQVFPKIVDGNIEIRFPTKPGRQYTLWYQNVLGTDPASWIQVAMVPIQGDGTEKLWVDDGSLTDPDPDDPALGQRFYFIEIERL